MSQHHRLMTLESFKVQHHHDHNHHERTPVSQEEEEDAPHNAFPIIYDAQELGRTIPDGFNAVRIRLDGRLKADLSWEKERTFARSYVERGYSIFWEIDLGLFSQLLLPATRQSQFLSLSLSLTHFQSTLWNEFRGSTVGICLYRGSANFDQEFIWDQEMLEQLQAWLKKTFGDMATLTMETRCAAEDFSKVERSDLSSTLEGRRLLALYCREVAAEYFDQLAEALSDSLPCYVLLDMSSISDPFLAAQLTTKEAFQGVCLGIRGKGLHEHALAWDSFFKGTGVLSRAWMPSYEGDSVQVGVCLPSIETYFPSKWQNIAHVMDVLGQKEISFRAIPEAFLTTDWDGLDYLIVSPALLSFQGVRKLQGFCAAGGVVVLTDGKSLGLCEEVSFDVWMKHFEAQRPKR